MITTLTCGYCNSRLNSINDLRYHLGNVRYHSVFSCCGRFFKRDVDLERHRTAKFPQPRSDQECVRLSLIPQVPLHNTTHLHCTSQRNTLRGTYMGATLRQREEKEVVKTQMIHRFKIRANASAFHQRSNDLNEIGGERSRSTVDLSSPPRRGQSSKLLVPIQRDYSTYHVSVVPVFSVIVMTCPFENEISPGYNANHVSRGSQSRWMITNLDCIEIKQRDRPSHAFSRGQRSSQLRLGRDNRSGQHRRRFIEELSVRARYRTDSSRLRWISVRDRHGRPREDVSRSIVRRVRGAVGVRPGDIRAR
jgi:hypothetical protein